MKALLNILGGLLLLGGIGGAIYIVVSVGTHTEGFETLEEMIPVLVSHALALFFGMVCIGIGQRIGKPSTE